MVIRTRTGYWVNKAAVVGHYGSEAEDALREGRAVIGEPPCPEGSILRISVVHPGGQWVIITPEPSTPLGDSKAASETP